MKQLTLKQAERIYNKTVRNAEKEYDKTVEPTENIARLTRIPAWDKYNAIRYKANQELNIIKAEIKKNSIITVKGKRYQLID